MKSIKNTILAVPFFYNLLQFLGGGIKAQSMVLHEIIDYDSSLAIIDLGCGTANILSSLPPLTDYYGCDSNAKYVEYAATKWGGGGRHFFVAEFDGNGKITPPKDIPKFDYAVALGCLHHLNDAQAVSLFQSASDLMKPFGLLLTIDLVRKANQNCIARFLINHDRGQYIRYESEYESLGKRVFADVTSAMRSDIMLLPQDVLVMQCSRPL